MRLSPRLCGRWPPPRAAALGYGLITGRARAARRLACRPSTHTGRLGPRALSWHSSPRQNVRSHASPMRAADIRRHAAAQVRRHCRVSGRQLTTPPCRTAEGPRRRAAAKSNACQPDIRSDRRVIGTTASSAAIREHIAHVPPMPRSCRPAEARPARGADGAGFTGRSSLGPRDCRCSRTSSRSRPASSTPCFARCAEHRCHQRDWMRSSPHATGGAPFDAASSPPRCMV